MALGAGWESGAASGLGSAAWGDCLTVAERE